MNPLEQAQACMQKFTISQPCMGSSGQCGSQPWLQALKNSWGRSPQTDPSEAKDNKYAEIGNWIRLWGIYAQTKYLHCSVMTLFTAMTKRDAKIVSRDIFGVLHILACLLWTCFCCQFEIAFVGTSTRRFKCLVDVSKTKYFNWLDFPCSLE